MPSSRTDTSAASEQPASKWRLSEEWLRFAHVEAGADREIKATGPGPHAEALRRAYLDLLKLCLCDLAGARTHSVSRATERMSGKGDVFSRELPAEELALRAKGADWPLSGLSMIGLLRLDDLQKCVESIVADGIEGDLIEAGTWRGGASILMRATLDGLGADERTLWVADSFQGLPAPDERFPEDRELDLSAIDFLAVPLEEVRSYFARFGLTEGVEFLQGFFEHTLPGLTDHSWSVVRLDGDTYESTWLGLESLYPALSVGGYLVIDDYLLIDECKDAVDDFRRAHGITEPIEEVDWNGVKWRRESDAAIEIPTEARRAAPIPELARTGERPTAPVPTLRERELESELADLRDRIEVATADAAALRASRAKRLTAFLRR
ncbi:MAG: class I SAM-dependent methyltransferase [Solirubrobacterales bacterium]|nr:class I SAM-dependent methyltransferase [Solirubrobacterales bacterium]